MSVGAQAIDARGEGVRSVQQDCCGVLCATVAATK